MRPHRYFACRDQMGLFHTVVKGQAEARRLSGGARTYKSFRTRLDAEEYAAWWNYEAPKRAAEWKIAFDKEMAQRKERWTALGVATA